MRTSEHTGQIVAPPGLAGVVVATTSISDIRPDEHDVRYRDRSAIELARTASFDDVWHLLLCGRMPGAAESAAFAASVAQHRDAPDVRHAGEDVRALTGDPLAAIRAGWVLLAARRGMRPLYDLDDAARRECALLLTAAVPALLAPPASRGSALGFVADHLARVTGEVPDAWSVRALTAYLIAAMDHGLNASTFTARVIASTGADLASCLTGALGALAGPLHGGAPSRTLDALDRFGHVSDIEPWVRAELAAGRRLMGFGHAVYRTADPRAQLLKGVAAERGGARIELAIAYERIAERVLAEVRPGRPLHANVELFAAVVMEQCGIPRALMTPTFALARTVGWSAHALEQAQDPKIIRPAARFAEPPA